MYVFRRLPSFAAIIAVCLAALGCLAPVQVAHATSMTDAAFDRFMMTTVGNDVTVGFGSGGVPVATNAAALGRPGTATASTNASGGLDFTRPVPVKTGTNVSDLSAKIPISKTAMGKAFAAAVALGGGPLGLAFYALPEILDWMNKAGLRRNAANDGFEKTDPNVCTVSPCYDFYVYSTSWPHSSTRFGACNAAAVYNYGAGAYGELANNDTFCYMYRANGTYGNGAGVYGGTVNPSPPSWLPASMDDIAPYMDKPTMAPEYAKALDKAGVKVDPDVGQKPEVTGPAKLPVSDKTVTKTNPDGTSSVERTICEKEMTYAGDKATMLEKCTVTTTNKDAQGNTVSTSTSESTEAKNVEKPDIDLCEKNPDILACKKLETPAEENLPKTDRNIAYTPESWFGGGSCPADKYLDFQGQHLKLIDWQENCYYLTTYLRPVLLVLAAFSALMILIPGVKE